VGQASWLKSSRKGIGVYTPTDSGNKSPQSDPEAAYGGEAVVGAGDSSLCRPYCGYRRRNTGSGRRRLHRLHEHPK